MASRPSRHAKTLGYVSPAVGVLTVAGLVFTAFVPGAVASSRSTSLSSAISDAVIMAAAAALATLGGSVRVLGTNVGFKVTNLFQVITVNGSAVASVEVTGGLVIVTTDGRRVRSFAYGASVIGDLLGYRRARAAQRRCDAWLTKLDFRGAADSGVVVGLRRAVWLLPAAFAAAYVAEVLVVRSMT
jgi:hypothetical protein